jgi:hypothetical protein
VPVSTHEIMCMEKKETLYMVFCREVSHEMSGLFKSIEADDSWGCHR